MKGTHARCFIIDNGVYHEVAGPIEEIDIFTEVAIEGDLVKVDNFKAFQKEIEFSFVVKPEAMDDFTKYIRRIYERINAAAMETAKRMRALAKALERASNEKEDTHHVIKDFSQRNWPDPCKKFAGYSYRPRYSRRCHYRNSRR